MEDEIHFLLTCHAYRDIRDKLFRKAYEYESEFYQQDEFEKFTFLMSNLQKPVIKYLTSAIAIRTKFLTVSNRN